MYNKNYGYLSMNLIKTMDISIFFTTITLYNCSLLLFNSATLYFVARKGVNIYPQVKKERKECMHHDLVNKMLI